MCTEAFENDEHPQRCPLMPTEETYCPPQAGEGERAFLGMDGERGWRRGTVKWRALYIYKRGALLGGCLPPCRGGIKGRQPLPSKGSPVKGLERGEKKRVDGSVTTRQLHDHPSLPLVTPR